MKIKKLLVANRGEIAIRIIRACNEIGLETVSIYSYEDRYSPHRYKADEAYQVGKDEDPLKPYLNMDEIVQLAKEKGVDAIHPGYGFLSENQHFAAKCRENGIIFVGPDPEVMARLGDKVEAKKVAIQNNVPIIESNSIDIDCYKTAESEALRIGLPVMLKAAAGGGGRGMRVIRSIDGFENVYNEARSEAKNAFGDDTVFIEKFVDQPKHIEIQIMADRHGNIVHLFERDCSVQRRFQKVVEVAPSYNLNEEVKNQLYKYAVNICKAVSYNNVGTVEFLVDRDDNVYFIEVNPRIQVEHTVTEMVTGVDLIKSQIFIAGGYYLSDRQINIPSQESLSVNGYAMQCRITTEDPEENFKPDYGTVTAYRSASGFGVRLDEGAVFTGAKISPFFDSMLVKVSSHSRSLDGAVRRMTRALSEFRIRGVKHNIPFLKNVINHEAFKNGRATVNFIQDNPELFKLKRQQDRASKILNYIGETVVNGNPDVKIIDPNKTFVKPIVPDFDKFSEHPKGTKDLLTELGPEGFSNWLKNEKKIHYTDTTMRDAHQSLLATRMRSYDILNIAESYAKNHPQTFSMEVWGGATFDVCLRFLYENPWKRLREIRKAVPNILLQMLLRGSNGVGYTAYPDNLIEKFVEEAWENGVDIFRIFDSLNWMDSMAPAIEFVRKRTNGLAEGALCYTGDILDPKRTKYDLKYYVQLAKDLENAGAHILAIKDMAGLLKPYAATELISALKSETNLPIHLHTHDTSSLQPATYLKAIEANVDVVDVALGGLSGLTSQPNFNSVVEMMRFHERENEFDINSLNEYSNYWETVREYYYPFESGLKASNAEVFKHEIPGGQYSNLKPQATALGLLDKFDQIKVEYGKVNQLFGDIVKVTPSSKVVGDMALYLISNGISADEVLEKGETISFPESVQAFFRGDLGQPVGGFPEELKKVILKDAQSYTHRPNEKLTPIDFDKEFKEFLDKFQKGFDRELEMVDFLSYKLYPKVFEDAYKVHRKYGDVSRVPTNVFFYGMKLNEETIVEIAEGKRILIQLVGIGQANESGIRTVFFKLNGQTRPVEVLDKSLKIEKVENKKVDGSNTNHVGAPLQGMLSKLLVKKGEVVKKNQPLFVIEAMKMETTIAAIKEGSVDHIELAEGTLVNSDDLVLSLN